MTGENIKNLRSRLDLNQAEFGSILGYTNPQIRISELENGKVLPSSQVIAAIRLLEENIKLKSIIAEVKKKLDSIG